MMTDLESIFYNLQVCFILLLCGSHISHAEKEDAGNSQRARIDGKVSVPFTSNMDWVSSTRILVDGGEYLGFLK